MPVAEAKPAAAVLALASEAKDAVAEPLVAEALAA